MTRTQHARTTRLRHTLVAGAAVLALAGSGLVGLSSAATAAPPGPPKTLTLSKATGIMFTGDVVTVSGTGFAANTSLFLSLCDMKDPGIMMGTGCLQDPGQFPVNIDQVTTNSSGAFSKAFQVNGWLRLSPTDIRDCLSSAVSCAVSSSNAQDPRDMTSIGFSGPLAFVPSLSAAGKAGAYQVARHSVLVTWTAAKSGPSSITSYTVQTRVKKRTRGWSMWRTAVTVPGAQTWARWNKAKTGKKYQLRVIAHSPVGSANSAGTAIRIR